MRILAVGDLVGQAGLEKFEQEYQKIKDKIKEVIPIEKTK